MVVMPDRCTFCSSGHAGSDYSGSYHSFPKGEKKAALREKWIKAVPFADWDPTKAKLCQRHFAIDDFLEARVDKKSSRNEVRGELKRHLLRDDAIPHVWPE